MSYLRLKCSYFSHPDTLAVGFWGSQVFLSAVVMAKSHGWRGIVPMALFTPEVVARHLNLVTERNAIKLLTDGLAKCIEHQKLVIDGTDYVIPTWEDFYLDRTNRSRQAKYRSTHRVRATKKKVTGRNGDTPSRNGSNSSSSFGTTGPPLAPAGTGAASPPKSGGLLDVRSYEDRLASVRKRALTASPEDVAKFAAILRVRWPE